MYEHYRSVQNVKLHNSIPVSRHFSGNNHSVKNMEFSVLHWMGNDTNPNSTKSHRGQGLFYIWAFPTPTPSRHQHVCVSFSVLLLHTLPRCPLFTIKHGVFSFTLDGKCNKSNCHQEPYRPKVILYLGISHPTPCRHQHLCVNFSVLL